MTDIATAERIPDAVLVAAQNDAFRRHACLGIPYGEGDPALAGRAVITQAVHAEGIGFVQSCLERIGWLDHFPAEDDPAGWHDFGSVEVFGTTVWFKLDLYADEAMARGADQPDDPSQTYRLLTVLFPSDW